MSMNTFKRMQIKLEGFFWPKADPRIAGAGARTPQESYQNWLRRRNDDDFTWQQFREQCLVFFVAASGFCTDSYNLFASNIILPELGYVYWSDDSYRWKVLAFNLATLAASMVGQLLFGLLADLLGRRSLYGIELVIVIISTLGLLQCSRGYIDEPTFTWHITPWLIFWRSVMGLGIGAEYPLSACIGAEWSSRKMRARLMSAVFLMQPIGQLSAYGAGLSGIRLFGGSRLGIDRLWRYVVGIGAIPTLLALISRLVMPEGGRYYYEVEKKANEDSISEEDNASNQLDTEGLWRYLFRRGHWIYLLGTSTCWFLLDVAFYGIGFNNPSTLSKLWSPRDLAFYNNAPGWLTTSSISAPSPPADPEAAILQVLETNITHALYTVVIASIVGSLAMIMFIDNFNRKHMLTISFAVVGLLLVTLTASFRALFHQEDKHVVLIVLWNLMSFLFSFGPNTLTFIIPAEIFPTRYRCTLYGVAAASGKLGALLAQIIVYKVGISSNVNSDNIRWALLGFAFCMFLGALCSHFTLPDVQTLAERRPPWYENKPLEELPPDPPAWAVARDKSADSDQSIEMEERAGGAGLMNGHLTENEG